MVTNANASRAIPYAHSWARGPVLPRGRWVRAAYVSIDIFFICANALGIFLLRFERDWLSALLWGSGTGSLHSAQNFANPYFAFLLLYTVLMVFALQSQDLYRTARTRSRADETVAVFKAVLFATLLLTAFIYLSNVKTISRLVVGATGVLNVLTLAAWRIAKRTLIRRRVAAEIGARNVLIVGAGATGQELARFLAERKELGYVVKGFLDADSSADARVLGRVSDLSRVARASFVDEIFITLPADRDSVREVLLEARRNRWCVRLVPELYEGFGWRAPLEYLGDFPVMDLHREPIPALGLLAKRAADVLLSAIALVALAPVFAAVAVAIKLDSPGPVFYRSLRVGKKGRRFLCFKFRSMVSNADALKDGLRDRNERQGPLFKITDDPRVTRVGHFLRKHSLDEFPQFWNVFLGDMSLVGPRPHPVDDCDRYELEHLRRLDVTPGLTGLWQVYGRKQSSFERALSLDLEYIETWNLWLDLKIALLTVPALFQSAGD